MEPISIAAIAFLAVHLAIAAGAGYAVLQERRK